MSTPQIMRTSQITAPESVYSQALKNNMQANASQPVGTNPDGTMNEGIPLTGGGGLDAASSGSEVMESLQDEDENLSYTKVKQSLIATLQDIARSQGAYRSEGIRQKARNAADVIKNVANDQSGAYKGFYQQFANSSQDLQNMLRFFDAIAQNNMGLSPDQGRQVMDAANQYITQLKSVDIVEDESKEKVASFNLARMAAKKAPPKTSYEKEQDEGEVDHSMSKGKHGNPFKVLLGMIGKAKSKGWSDIKVIRHIQKTTGFKEDDLIKKALKIVKDRSKKEHRQKSEGVVASSNFNLRRMANSMEMERAAEGIEPVGLYAIEPDLTKRSTRELMDRIFYLTSCMHNDKIENENGPKVTISSIGEKLKKCEDALKDSGWSTEEIKDIYFTISDGEYEPGE